MRSREKERKPRQSPCETKDQEIAVCRLWRALFKEASNSAEASFSRTVLTFTVMSSPAVRELTAR